MEMGSVCLANCRLVDVHDIIFDYLRLFLKEFILNCFLYITARAKD